GSRVREFVGRGVPIEFHTVLAVAAKGDAETLILLQTVARLDRQKIILLEQMVEAGLKVPDKEAGVQIAVLVELGRVVIAGQGTHPNLQISVRRGSFLRAQGRPQQQGKRQEQYRLESASSGSHVSRVHRVAPSALEPAARR